MKHLAFIVAATAAVYASAAPMASELFVTNKIAEAVAPLAPRALVSAAAQSATNYTDAVAAGKQDTISDLAAIRSGAALGATALQSYTETDPTIGNYAAVSNAAMSAIRSETDPVWTAEKGSYATKTALSAAALAGTNYTDAVAATKQPTISDLAAIRSGAALGATALQSYTETDPVWIAEKGSYATKTALAAAALAGTNYTDAVAATKQPTISDLAAIRSGAALGATALQSYTETDPVWTAEKSGYATTVSVSDLSAEVAAIPRITESSLSPGWAENAETSGYANEANHASSADNADYAISAGSAGSADYAERAGSADAATSANSASSADHANSANTANSAGSADALLDSTDGEYHGGSYYAPRSLVSDAAQSATNYTAAAALAGTNYTDAVAATKQPTISDLAAIRSGAALGATALQSFTESDPGWIADKPSFATRTEVASVAQSATDYTASAAQAATNYAAAVAQSATNYTDTTASTLRDFISAKQDSISDLAAIRSGAALGATALQSFTESDPTIYAWAKGANKPTYTYAEIASKPTFATVATSGSYNDLSDKPSIPSPSAPVSSATLAWQSSGSAITVSVAAAGTLSATLTGWIEGQTQTALITIAAGASVSANVKLVGYGTWPTGGQFLASATRVGNNIYVTPIVLIN